jgi:tetratricopeptide (TPR) repeat protein
VASDYIQRQVERLLGQAEQALDRADWQAVKQQSESILALDPDNRAALALLAAAARAVGQTRSNPEASSTAPAKADQPTSFASGRYEVKRFLGEGGKKKVYLAHDNQLDRDVAFALIKTEGLDEAARERVTREAQAMGRLGSHPHIVTVFDIGDHNGQPYLVLPLLPGGDIEGVIEEAPGHRLPLERALKIAIDTCNGLEFAHAKGIIHRDLKPGNVWLAEDERAMIGDFGLAVAVDRSRLTQAGVMVGTVNYMPPEQAMGGEVGPRSDLYSLGCMLYEMVCGRPPFVGDESVAIIGQHLNTPPVAPTWHRPDCPPGLEALILRLLEKDATKRPASAAEVRQALLDVSSARPEALEGRAADLAAHGSSASPRADGATTDPLYRRVFVGREQELKQLQAAFDAALSGEGSLAMVVGEPGIGKTSVCEQLATYVALRGGKALAGHCYEEGSLSLPYLPFVEAMRSYVLAREPEALRSDLGTAAGDVARIVSEVTDRVPGVELRPAGDPEDDRWRLLQSVTSFLRNASNVQPLFILLEDLHDADRGTLDLLVHLSHNLQGARLLIVGTYRDVEVDRAHPLSTALAELRRQGSFLRVPLRGLTVDEVHRMYTAIRGQEVSWTQAEAVHRQTEGNPLFIQEVLRYLVEEGLVVRQGDRYVPQGEPGAGIPEGLRDVIGKRLSRLSDKANQLLSIAAVIGRDFRLDVLQKVAGLPEEEVDAALEEAADRALVEARQGVGTLAFRFTHAFFRQTLYEETFASRRLRVHQQVARALEEVYGRRVEEHAAELAEHYAQSTNTDDLRKALHFSEVAAERASSVYAHGDTVRHLEQAVKVQEVLDPDDKAKISDLLVRLSEALGDAGGQSRRRIDELAPGAISLADAIGDRQRMARSRLELLSALQSSEAGFARTSVQFRQIAEQAMDYSQPRSPERVRVMRLLAASLRYSGEREKAWQMLLEARQLAMEQADEESASDATAGLLRFRAGPEYEAPQVELAREVASAKASGYHEGDGGLLFGLAWKLLGVGERDLAVKYWHELAELDLLRHGQGTRLNSRTSDVFRRILSGELDDSLELGIEMEQSRGEVTAAGKRYRALATRTALLYLGRGAEALNDLEGARSVAAIEGDSPDSAVQRVLCLAHLGRREEARSLLPNYLQSRDISHPNDDSPTWLLNNLAEIAVLLEDRDLASKVIRRLDSVASLVPSGPNFFHTCVARHLGGCAALLGEAEKARNYDRQALELCNKIGFRPEIALTRLQLAELLLEHYPDERDVAIEHLDFAIREFQEMKMQPSLERALKHRGLLKA